MVKMGWNLDLFRARLEVGIQKKMGLMTLTYKSGEWMGWI